MPNMYERQEAQKPANLYANGKNGIHFFCCCLLGFIFFGILKFQFVWPPSPNDTDKQMNKLNNWNRMDRSGIDLNNEEKTVTWTSVCKKHTHIHTDRCVPY